MNLALVASQRKGNSPEYFLAAVFADVLHFATSAALESQPGLQSETKKFIYIYFSSGNLNFYQIVQQ